MNAAWSHVGHISDQPATKLPPSQPNQAQTTSSPQVLPTSSPQKVAQNFVVGCHVKAHGVSDPVINGHIGTMIGMQGQVTVKVNFQGVGLKLLPKTQLTVVQDGFRRLRDQQDETEKGPAEYAIKKSEAAITKVAPVEEVDRFIIEIDPKALSYKIDETLMQELLRRQGFRGLEDGREHELGKAKITHFRIHRGEPLKHVERDDAMIPVGSEAKFEWDSHIDYEDAQAPQASFTVAMMVAGVAVLSIVALSAGSYLNKRSSQVLPYLSVQEPDTRPVE